MIIPARCQPSQPSQAARHKRQQSISVSVSVSQRQRAVIDGVGSSAGSWPVELVLGRTDNVESRRDEQMGWLWLGSAGCTSVPTFPEPQHLLHGNNLPGCLMLGSHHGRHGQVPKAYGRTYLGSTDLGLPFYSLHDHVIPCKTLERIGHDQLARAASISIQCDEFPLETAHEPSRNCGVKRRRRRLAQA